MNNSNDAANIYLKKLVDLNLKTNVRDDFKAGWDACLKEMSKAGVWNPSEITSERDRYREALKKLKEKYDLEDGFLSIISEALLEGAV